MATQNSGTATTATTATTAADNQKKLAIAVAAIERFAAASGGRVNLSPVSAKAEAARLAFSKRFPGVNLSDVLTAGAVSEAFILSGADLHTVITNQRAAKMADKVGRDGRTATQRKAAIKSARVSMQSKLDDVKFGAIL
jgi:hypothetical protein